MLDRIIELDTILKVESQDDSVQLPVGSEVKIFQKVYYL